MCVWVKGHSFIIFFFKPADQEDRTKDAVLNLIIKCLSYDFAGTTLDEAGEDTGMVQVKYTRERERVALY